MRGDVERALMREQLRSAAERFFGGDAGDVGRIVFFGKVREDEIACASIEDVGIGEKFADDGVGKMAGASHDALLDVPRIWADFEHLEIVIRFEHQEIGFAEMKFDVLGHVAEVGDDGGFGAAGAESVADGLSGVMRDGERRDFDVANFKANARANVLEAVDAGFGAGFFLRFGILRIGAG